MTFQNFPAWCFVVAKDDIYGKKKRGNAGERIKFVYEILEKTLNLKGGTHNENF